MLYTVGQPLIEGRNNWNEETRLFVRENRLELLIFVPEPTSLEVDAVVGARLDVGLYSSGREHAALFFLYRLWENRPRPFSPTWRDTVYHHMALPVGRQGHLEELPVGQKGQLQVVLTDCVSGIVVARQEMTVSRTLHNRLVQLVQGQMKEGFDAVRHQMELDQVYQRYPTAVSMVRAAYITEEVNV